MSSIDTACLDFRLASVPTANVVLTKVVRGVEAVLDVQLEPQGGREQLLQQEQLKPGTIGCWESKKDDAFLLIRLYDKCQGDKKLFVLTATVEYPNEIGKVVSEKLDRPLIEVFEEKIVLESDIKSDDYLRFVLPPIRRGLRDPPYLISSDDRIFEHRVESVLFSERSKYQRIQIFDTLDFGAMLVLDGYVNLAESDRQAYTLSLMDVPKEKFDGKQVLILGGGDGALMKELMEFSPEFVTMVDIDDMVMSACRRFMPSVCGKYLDEDKRSGPNYKIIVGDAIAFMQEAKASGRKFDYIFGDLTDIPVRAGPDYASGWQFIETIVGLALSLLKEKTGKYLSHSNGKNVPDAVAHYEQMLGKLGANFIRRESFVPSFMETWLLYTITNKQ